MNALAGNDPAGHRDPMFAGRQTGRNAAVIGLALASGLRVGEFTHLTVYEVPALPSRRTGVPVPMMLAPPTTKGGKGRSSWIDYDAPGPGPRLHRLRSRGGHGWFTAAAVAAADRSRTRATAELPPPCGRPPTPPRAPSSPPPCPRPRPRAGARRPDHDAQSTRPFAGPDRPNRQKPT